MSLFTVDKDKCKRDGICVAECPFGLIEIKDKETGPVAVKGADEYCINCGHCVAVCPHGALSLKTMSPAECVPLNEELKISLDQAEQLLMSRRSIRTYVDRPVDKELLLRLVNAVRYSPTGRNTQPVKWMIIYDKNEVVKLEGMAVEWMRYMIKEQQQFASMMNLDHIVRLWDEDKQTPITCGAPHMLIAYASKDMLTSQEASIIAMAAFDIAAPAYGLGTCWAGYFNAAAKFWPALNKALRIPEGHVPFCSMMIGYPKYKYRRIPVRNKAEITWR